MADDTIGSLVAIVKATADQFAADMKKVNSTLDELKHKAQESGEGVKSAFEIGAAVELFHQAMEKAIEVSERFFAVFEKGHHLEVLADELNSTATELSGLDFVAAQIGQTSDEFERGLGKMVQKIGEAREGSAKTSVAFQALGLDINHLAGMSAGGAFEEIGERFRQLPNAADRAALAVELFGKAGRQMIPMLMESNEEMASTIAHGRELGAVMGPQMAEELAKGQKAIIEMKAALEGMANRVAAANSKIVKDLIPIVEWYAKIPGQVAELDRLIRSNPAMAGREKGEQLRAEAEERKRLQEKIEGPNIVARLEASKKEAKELEKIAEKTTKDMAETHKRALAAEKRDMEEWSRAAKRMADEARSPMEKFVERVREVKEALAEGAINFRQFEQLAAKAGAEVERAFDKHKEKEDHGMRGGIAAADIFTSAGASLDISAGRALQDIQLKDDNIQAQQLESLQRHETLLQQIRDAAGRGLDLGVADF